MANLIISVILILRVEYYEDRRRAAHRKLAMILKEIEPDWNEDVVKVKMNNLRFSVLKE